MPEKVALIDKSVGTDTLALPEVFERPAGMQAVTAHLELLTVTGGVELTLGLTIEVWQLHPIHGLDHGIVGNPNILQREAPIDRVIQFALCDKRGNPRHLPHTDPAAQSHDPGQQCGM